MFRNLVSIRSLASVFALVALMFGTVATTTAQESTEEVVSHPAFIEPGDCAAPEGNPVATLNPVEAIGAPEEGDDEVPEVQGSLLAVPVFYSLSDEIELPFDDMLAESHVIAIHESETDIQTYLACGEIGGIVVDDKLVVALNAVDGSGYAGIAILTTDGDGNADVEVYLATGTSSEATPAA